MLLSFNTLLLEGSLLKRDRMSMKVIIIRLHQQISCKELTLNDLTSQLKEAIKLSNKTEDQHGRQRLGKLIGTNSVSKTILWRTSSLLPSCKSPLSDMLKVKSKNNLTETEVNKLSMVLKLISQVGANRKKASLWIFLFPNKSSKSKWESNPKRLEESKSNLTTCNYVNIQIKSRSCISKRLTDKTTMSLNQR